ncbi:MAG: NADH:ubiquinone oxidoreductase, partial [Chitinivibrionales bacterium]|nr:NADH:ubiquinone oxidoreductase [Chitinivibrionales bacterium]MBD3357665.1 NADH:ubiquinone oxidoreductase [Chitinivibrionales bacterium]
VVIRLCDDIIHVFKGMLEIIEAFKSELGVGLGEDTPDGVFSLRRVPHIGMSDQAPAALINDIVVTNLTPEKVPVIVDRLRANQGAAALVKSYGDGNNAHPLVRAMVNNNIRARGEVLLSEFSGGSALAKAMAKSPRQIIAILNDAQLRGRGGAGFPAGMKWEFTRRAQADRRYVICNGDEGEPGSFKDRVLLTEYPQLMFEGMTIAGYAVGATKGILYLRHEYAYLLRYLQSILDERRRCGLLGVGLRGPKGFTFDIRIQLGAGAYICGEETSLIASCEGKRGDPKTRPPFPTKVGYRNKPTIVNNVETMCCAAKIVLNGPDWFKARGTPDSTGTKLLSVSGDCDAPGVYELPFGVPLGTVLERARARNPYIVQVGGPSGTMVPRNDFHRRIGFEDLPTGGAVTVFNRRRDPLEIVGAYLAFFIEESCGYCTPCRVGNVLLRDRIELIAGGKGEMADLEYLEDLGRMVKFASRCGLGQTSPNPVLTSLSSFRNVYEQRCSPAHPAGRRRSFNLSENLTEAEAVSGRESEDLTQ